MTRRRNRNHSERRKQAAQEFKDIQLASSPKSDASHFSLTPPKGASIGVPLENCPRSSKYENIPRIVEQCVEIVEAHGLENVGVYRVPGNFAVINALTESFNRGDFGESDWRWNDVNAISSVMKSFFRKLPDPLVTSELYGAVIEASKLEPEQERLNCIKRLVDDLPDPHYSTLRYLVGHLSRVAGSSDVNKMNARNLATVFGPTLVRSADDNMATMMADMPHQCRIVETLIDKIEFFFPSPGHNQVITADAQQTEAPPN
jgi:hypothetical protein